MLPAEDGLMTVVGGAEFSVALTKGGSLFSWGKREFCGLHGVTGGGDAEAFIKSPEMVFKKGIVSVSANRMHTLCTDGNGDVFSFGTCTSCELGPQCQHTKGSHHEPQPFRIHATNLDRKFAFQVACGALHSLTLAWDWRTKWYLNTGDDYGKTVVEKIL